ncbi:MAG: hypothetical protein R3F59_19485 [Myxococcota bacterium]
MIIALLTLLAAPAHASGEAEGAEVAFQLGADAYTAGQYEDALAHFLMSNRLAPNPSVAFNIARCHVRLQKYPEAHRWFTVARRTG